MQVLIFGKSLRDSQLPTIQSLINTLINNGIKTTYYKPFWELIKNKLDLKSKAECIKNYEELKHAGIDFVLTLGGDGTILSATTLIKDSGIPIMGINLGRLGFLASIEEKYISNAIDLLLKGKYVLDSRSLIQLVSSKPIFGENLFALNDFTILKRDHSSMILIHVYVNEEFLNSYWADGLIVATPTGSTGYSLSCGGPILFPDSNNFIITPVAPHNLSVRPIVLSNTAEISFRVEGRTENFLCTLDSRSEIIDEGFNLKVKHCDFKIHLIQLPGMSFSKTMRNKLNWGFDMRKIYKPL
jgi:NAD+ kinase